MLNLQQGKKIVIGFFLLSLVMAIAKLGKILNLLYPAGALGLGWILYSQHPFLYVRFTWWLFFLTPFMRRLGDYNSSFTDPSPILLAPFVTSAITLVTLYKYLPKIITYNGLPFLLSLTGIAYGYCIALVSISPVTATIALLNWLCPVVFGFHLFIYWSEYPSYRQVMEQTFIGGILVSGTYGIYQYIVAPEWDRYWLVKTGLFTSMGSPEPYGMRVWSTMNSPLPFAVTAVAGLIILLITKSPWRLPASGVGYLSILLTSVRTSWLGWFVALITLSVSLNPKLQVRLGFTMMLIAILVIPLATIEPFAEIITSRLESFTNIEEDNSFNDRQELYQKTLDEAIGTVIGNGIGSSGPGFDSGILDILLSLGWLGAIPYLGGIALIFVSLYLSSQNSYDGFAAVCKAIITGIFPMLLGASVLVALSGMIFWSFAAMGLAAKLYNDSRNFDSSKKQ